MTIPGEVSDNSAKITGLSRSRPDNPAVNVPLALKELGDFPSMLRTMGIKLNPPSRNAKKKRRRPYVEAVGPSGNPGDQYLSQVFGWAPFYRDLAALLKFQSVVDKKQRELESMYKSGGIRRRVQVFNGSQYAETTDVVVSNPGLTIKRTISRRTSVNKWYVVRWKPTAIPKDMSNPALHKLAMSIAYGGRQNAADAWNAVPWSWMADWFGNYGDFINAHSNRIPIQAGTGQLMVHRKTEEVWSYPRGNTSVYTGGVGSRLREVKSRSAYPPTSLPDTHLPFLGGGQLAILGALAASRRSR